MGFWDDALSSVRRSGWGGDDAKQYQMDEDQKQSGSVPTKPQPQTAQNSSDSVDAIQAMRRRQQAGGNN